MEASSRCQPQTTYTPEQIREPLIRKYNDVYTNQSDNDSALLHDHVYTPQPWTSQTHLLRQNAASYYTLTQSHQFHRTTFDRTTPKSNGCESESSLKGDYVDKSYASGHENTNPVVHILSFYSCPVGPPHVGLRSIKSAKKKLDKLMTYRSCRLMITTYTVHRGDFLIRVVNDADMLHMSVAQAFIALESILGRSTETRFRTILSGASLHCGITCWPEAIQYLFPTYATASVMRESFEDLCNIKITQRKLKIIVNALIKLYTDVETFIARTRRYPST